MTPAYQELAWARFCATVGTAARWIRGAWMPKPASDDRLIVRFDLDDPMDLDDLSEGFIALSRQYRKMLGQRGITEDQAPTRLLVTRLESGSLETEIAFWSLVGWSVVQSMDASLIMSDFATRIRGAIAHFAGHGGRPPVLDQSDVSDFEKFIKPLAGRRNSKLTIRTATFREKTGDHEIHASYEFDEKDLAGAFANMGRKLETGDDAVSPTHLVMKNVVLYWAQTNWSEAKSSRRTGDRAIAQKITDKPLPVYFTSRESTIKYKMTGGDFNPSKRAYMVDLDVQYVGDKPAAYTIMELHDIIDIEDDQSQNKLLE